MTYRLRLGVLMRLEYHIAIQCLRYPTITGPQGLHWNDRMVTSYALAPPQRSPSIFYAKPSAFTGCHLLCQLQPIPFPVVAYRSLLVWHTYSVCNELR